MRRGKVGLEGMEAVLGIKFRDQLLLSEALTHRSYLNENRGSNIHPRHNERLEFLGDAVIELVVTDHLYRTFPDLGEGELTQRRASIVNTTALAIVANALRLEDGLLMSRGESRNEGARKRLLACAFEAVVGAIYLDQGHGEAEKFILRTLIPLAQVLSHQEPKSLFQEEAQERVGITPRYELLKEEGPAHAKEFEVGVYLGDELVARGAGSSKKRAEVEAARAALEVKGWK